MGKYMKAGSIDKFSHQCIASIVTMSEEFCKLRRTDVSPQSLRHFVLSVHHLAYCVAEFERSPMHRPGHFDWVVDGYFLGNLIDAAYKSKWRLPVQLLVEAAVEIPELMTAIKRDYDRYLNLNNSGQEMQKNFHHETLKKIVKGIETRSNKSDQFI